MDLCDHQKQQLVEKSDDIVLLEKQGRSSQKMRTPSGNLLQVTTDIGRCTMDSAVAKAGQEAVKRGNSLPPRNLKPPSPRKTFGGRLNENSSAANYQRLEERSSPTKKRSLLPLPKMTSTMRSSSTSRGSTMGSSSSPKSSLHFGASNSSYMPIAQRSPSPARHAHFILGHPQQQQPQSPSPQLKSASLDRQSPSVGKGSLSSRSSVNRYRIQF